MSEPPAPPPEDFPAADVPAAEAAAPADLAPAPSRRARLAWYAGTVFLAAALAAGGMQLWKRDLHAPFYYDLDGLLYLPLVRGVVEQGFWNCWHNDRLGAPGRQELYDFPIIDFLHFAFLWAISRVWPDVILTYNIYSLLCYPLTALTAMWVMRWLRLSLPAAAVGGLLYAFIPYHQERFQYHYFLAAYWWVPVSMLPALAICKGNFPFFRRGPDGQYPPVAIDWPAVGATAKAAARGSGAAWKSVLGWVLRSARTALRELFTWRGLRYAALGAVTASAGAYYAFFACATYGFAGAYGWVVHRTWRAAASAALVTAPVVGVGLAYHVPTYLYQSKFGVNPVTQRYPEEADNYGLKIAHLLLPANDHNFRLFANLRAMFSTPGRPAEGESAGSLGLVGGTGLLVLLGMAVLPYRRRWPESAASALVLYLVLLGTIGAFGSLFNLLVTPQIRAYNRIGVFVAFLGIFVVLWWLDRFLLTRTGKMMRQARYPVLAAVLMFGYFDQTPWGWNPINPKAMEKFDLQAERFRADKEHFERIERHMQPGAKVFCLPYTGFPESPPVYKMGNYEHGRGYLLTDTLCWSYGSIKGREADAWYKDVAHAKHDEMLRRIVARGFDGLLIDGRGFPAAKDVDHAAALVNRINQLFGAVAGPRAGLLPQIVHEDGKQFFLDLRPYRDAYRRVDPAGYADGVTREEEWVAALWLGGFHLTEPPDEGGERVHWGPFDADLVLVNPADRTRRFDVSFSIGTEATGPFDVRFGAPFNESFQLDKITDPNDPQNLKWHGVPKQYTVELPPGRTVIHIRCRPPEYFLPIDKKNLCYYIREFRLREK
jgi:hypothetical protein